MDFGLLIPWKLDLLQKAFSRFQSAPEHLRQAFDYFRAENAAWLDDYTLFMALKESNGGGAWNGWPEALRKRRKTAIEESAE